MSDLVQQGAVDTTVDADGTGERRPNLQRPAHLMSAEAFAAHQAKQQAAAAPTPAPAPADDEPARAAPRPTVVKLPEHLRSPEAFAAHQAKQQAAAVPEVKVEQAAVPEVKVEQPRDEQGRFVPRDWAPPPIPAIPRRLEQPAKVETTPVDPDEAFFDRQIAAYRRHGLLPEAPKPVTPTLEEAPLDYITSLEARLAKAEAALERVDKLEQNAKQQAESAMQHSVAQLSEHLDYVVRNHERLIGVKLTPAQMDVAVVMYQNEPGLRPFDASLREFAATFGLRPQAPAPAPQTTSARPEAPKVIHSLPGNVTSLDDRREKIRQLARDPKITAEKAAAAIKQMFTGG